MDLRTFIRSLPDEPSREAFGLACRTTIGHLRNVGYGYKPAAPLLCAAVELATDGKVTCEEQRPDLDWSRIKDKAWPHPKGRPVHDVAASAAA